jgi:hypothetical protein
MPETYDDEIVIWPLDDPKEPPTGGSTISPNPAEVQSYPPPKDVGDDQQ